MRNLPQKAIKRISAAILAFLSVASIFTAVIAASTALSAHTASTGEGLFGAKAAFANSAQRYYEGVDSGGVAIRYKGGLVSVKSEELTFDIYNEQSKNYYPQGSNFGKVTAKYEFLNEGETAAKVGLLFPFGFRPSYGYEKLPETVYSVKKNGKEIQKSIRHSYKYRYSDFDLETDAELLIDGYVEDEFYSPELKLFKRVYRVSEEAAQNAVFTFSLKPSEKRSIICDAKTITSKYGTSVYAGRIKDGYFTVYFLGEDRDDFDAGVQVYKTADAGDTDRIETSIIPYQRTETTFGEFVDRERTESNAYEVSQEDWYNAVIYSVYLSGGSGLLSPYSFNVKDELFRWYEYELDFGAGETVTNEVVAPLYPSVNFYFEPAKYSFTYLLSPAKTWMSFENLTVKINTDMFLTDVNSSDDKKISAAAKSLVRTETGYEASFDKLPEGELVFTLCASENPEYRRWNEGWGTVGIILIVLMFVSGVVILAPIVTGVVLVVIYNKNRKKIREAEAAEKAKTENVTERVTENADETEDKKE